MAFYADIAWPSESPRLLVAGEGPLAVVLGQVLDGHVLDLDSAGRQAECVEGAEESSRWRFLDRLEMVMLVVPPSAGMPEVAARLEWMAGLVERFTPMGEEQDLKWLWVPVAGDVERFTVGLRVILALPQEADLASVGHGIWEPKWSLKDLGRVWQGIVPSDLLALRARRRAEPKRRALMSLLSSLGGAEADAVEKAAREVREQFPKKEEYLLDVFCREPTHPNGGRLRRWIEQVVTQGITPESMKGSHADLAQWLKPEIKPTI